MRRRRRYRGRWRRSGAAVLLALVPVVLGTQSRGPPALAAGDPTVPDARWTAWAAHVDVLATHPPLAWWDAATARLEAGEPAATLHLGLIESPAWRSTIAPVLRLYRAAFGRPPDSVGADSWIDERVGGRPLGAIATAFAGSAEHVRRYAALSDAAYVGQLYANALGRAADPAGLAHWVARLAGGAGRAQVLLAISEAPEHVLAAGAWTEVAAVFASVQRETPDPTAFAAALARRQADGHVGGLLASALEAPAYRARWTAPLAPAPYPRLRVLLLGDSLAWEAEPYARWLLQERGTAEVRSHTFCGTAPCDWLGELEWELNSWHPNIVVAVFSGNAMTACMAGWESGAAFAERYLTDARRYVELAGAAGADVLFVSPPARRERPGLGHPAQVAFATASAERPALASWVYGGTHVSPGDIYVDTLSCEPGEPCMHLDGLPVNRVRHPDGLHFCPVGTPRDWGVRCDVHSPGALRYATTIAAAVRARYG